MTGLARQLPPGVGPSGQLPLPALSPVLRSAPSFAHPFERHFSELLTAYGIRWRYEPTTFLLARRPDGSPAECFTPDFYLPDARTYVELTSMRQSLVTRKHRKIRRFRAACPGSRVILLYRRDYHRMLAAWSVFSSGSIAPGLSDVGAIGRVVVSAETVQSRLSDLADGLASRHARHDEMPTLVAIGAGGSRVASDLAARLATIGAATDLASLSLGIVDGRVRVSRFPSDPMAGRPVIVVAGMISTGLSLDYLTGWLRRRRVDVVDSLALLDRRASRVSVVSPNHVGFEVAADLLVGYGLDLHRQFTDLPLVATLDHWPQGLAPGPMM